jgi:acyl-coenzyme A synthetase/AMP-(fatty) acid ligase
MLAPEYFNFATDVFDPWAAQRGDAPCLWWVDAVSGTEKKFSFQQLAKLSSKAANFLSGCGIRSGDRVMVMLPRVPEWWVAMLGLIRLGAVPVPATLLLTSRDIEYRLRAASVSAVITNAEGGAKVNGFEGIRICVGESDEGWVDFARGISRAGATFKPVLTRSNDPGMLFFTSATTGDPKMVLHTQVSYGLGHRLTGDLWLDLGPKDVHWNISDLGWGKAAWSSFYGPWHMGACVFALDARGKFDPVLALDTLQNYPITTWCAPPTALRLIVRQNLGSWKFPNLRHCVTAGEPLNPEVLNLWQTATGLTLYEAYGQTESVILIGNFRKTALPVVAGSMGQATPGIQIDLLDDELREVPPGTEGEIAVRMRPTRPVGLFAEYWLNPEQTHAQFVGDHYLTGDRAVRDKDGYFWFIGRKDDVIKSSGYRIGPFEVESALLEHPAVLEVAVVGKPDPLRGQIVKAFVVLREKVPPGEELKTELQVHSKRLVAAYKYPREIEFVSELPKTISGKTRRVELRNHQQFANK